MKTICVRGYHSALSADPTMTIDKVTEYSRKVCAGLIADYNGETKVSVESMINVINPVLGRSRNVPYKSNLKDMCTKKPCIRGKACMPAGSKLPDSSKVCLGTRELNPSIEVLDKKLDRMQSMYVVMNDMLIGVIDNSDNFNIVRPCKFKPLRSLPVLKI